MCYIQNVDLTSKIPAAIKDVAQYKYIMNIITSIQYCIVDDIQIKMVSRLLEPNYSQLKDVLNNLAHISKRLNNGILCTGVVGVTKAGKSTVLNALLGKEYLPSSIQPQTAKEVSIVHDPEYPEGFLLGKIGSRIYTLGKGKENISSSLKQLNDDVRSKSSKAYDKIVLRAPLKFLENETDVSLELSDTPGLNEAGATFTSESDRAIRNMAAYIVILHMNFLKTKAESTLFRNLRMNHPLLLKKLKRIIILVNAYDLTFKDTNPGALKHTGISSYVSNYLREGDILGEKIDPRHIVPFSGLWALRGLQWSSDPYSLLQNSTRGETQYNFGVNMLDWADYNVSDLNRGFTKENIMKASRLLYEFSNISKVHNILLDLLHENGEEALFESALDDTALETEHLTTLITDCIKNESLETKEEHIEAYRNLIEQYNAVTSKHFPVITEKEESEIFEDYMMMNTNLLIDSVQASVDALVHALQDSIHGNIKSKLTEFLHNAQAQSDKTYVQSQIFLVKKAIPPLVQTKMKVEWVKIFDVLSKGATDVITSGLSMFRFDLSGITSTTAIAGHQFFKQLIEKIERVRSIADNIVPQEKPPIFEINYDGKGHEDVDDQKIKNMLIEGTSKKFDTHEERVCGGKKYILWCSKDCVTITVATPKDEPNYSPNFISLENAFSEVIMGWVEMFKKETYQVMNTLSWKVSSKLLAELADNVKFVYRRLKDLLLSSEELLKESKDVIDVLQSKSDQLELLKIKLKKKLSYFMYE